MDLTDYLGPWTQNWCLQGNMTNHQCYIAQENLLEQKHFQNSLKCVIGPT